MKTLSLALAASAAVFAFLPTAFAQDTMQLPKACQTETAKASKPQAMPGMLGMGDAQKAMMEGMMKLHDPMMAGMMAKDPDVAFICGMIPHHQGAINMAKVELQYGDSDWAKKMAQSVIDAQQKEIAEMTKWLDEQVQ